MPTLKELFLAELKQEGQATTKTLANVPADKKAYKPHDKSMTLESLAKHLADIPKWASLTATQDELDFAKGYPKTPEFSSGDELASQFNANLDQAIKDLSNMNEADLDKPWTLRNGEQVYFTMPKHAVLRTFVLNHQVHHRAQLGVYLRLNNCKVPGAYGPTADDQM